MIKAGQIKLVPSLHGRGNFHEGLALVMIDGKYNYIDKSLKVVIPSNFDVAGEFSKVGSTISVDLLS